MRGGRTTSVVSALFLVFGAAACGIVETTATQGGSDLESARALWRQAAIDDYDLAMTRRCFCAFVGEVTVQVRGGVRTATVVAEDISLPLTPAFEQSYPTVDGLFALIDEAIADGVHELRVTYHPVLGYPTLVSVDRRRQVDDDEVAYEAHLDPVG